ncbi:MAG: hypothetical protein U0136_03145 [Bdellovibrionota bacterium]
MGKAKAAPEVAFSSRLLIMLFALAIVVIGVYPIRKQIRHAVEGARRFVHSALPTLRSDSWGGGSIGDDASDGHRFSFTDDTQDGASEPPVRRPERVTVDRELHKKNQLDRITPNDRKQLSDLVNSF